MSVGEVGVSFRVERPGGGLEVHDLTGHRAPGSAGSAGEAQPLVIAAHGITANALSW